MAKKILGYVELEWTCKRCGTKNPGMQKTCSNCGGPMETRDEFELPEEQKLISDADKLADAQKGVDIHCPYCGTRNPAGTEVCIQCGGDLKEGAARETGQVLGAHSEAAVAEIACPYCAFKVKANAERCPNCGGDLAKEAQKPAQLAPAPQKMPIWMMIGIGILLMICVGGVAAFAILGSRTDDVQARVQGVTWQRSIEILEERPAERGAWESSLPAGAENVSCEDRYRETSDVAAPKFTEVCGTPYTIDQGTGAGKVVQDCEYLVYDSYCEFTVLEWQVVSQPTIEGNDLQPYWPELSLTSGQREGDRSENYIVIFEADGRTYDYAVNDPELFAAYTPGSEWTLKVNAFGAINEIIP
ncbi:MAG: zinc ribbon domain-containing protein [Chloroflexi bacterium]|nr:MAG: zinc ribbon domain-containing protein [Chloroflexota bacterium]